MSEVQFKEAIINYEADPSLSSVKTYISLKRLFTIFFNEAFKDIKTIVVRVQKHNEYIYVYTKNVDIQIREPFEDLEYRYTVSQAKLEKLMFEHSTRENEIMIRDITYQVTQDDVLMVITLVKGIEQKPQIKTQPQDTW